MGAFDGLRLYQMQLVPAEPEAPPGPPAYPGDWVAENSNQPYEYPWGHQVRNPWFIGPYPKDAP